MHLPPLVTEVPLDLAADAGRRVRGQAAAERRVVVVDRLEQADVAHLHQVFHRLGAAAVLPDAGADQPLVPLHQDLAGDGALVAVPGCRAEAGKQGIVGELRQFGTAAEDGCGGGCLGHGHLRGVGNTGRRQLCPQGGV